MDSWTDVNIALQETQLAPLSNGSQPSSIRSLPNELLAAIFEAGARLPAHRLPFPLLAGSVNRHWRGIAINSPNVWSIIRISSIRQRPFTLLCLQRSKSCALDITVTIPHSWGPHIVRDRIGILLQHIDRWRRLVVKTVSRLHMEQVVKLLQSASSRSLEHIQLRAREFSMNVLYPFLTGGSPTLRSVNLDGVPFKCSPLLINLRTLSLSHSDPTYRELRGVLTACPSLTELVLRKCEISNVDSSLPSIEIPSLRSLAISSPKGPILSFLSMPNIEYLEVADQFRPDDNSYFRVNSESPYSKLRTLRIYRLDLSSNDVEFLQAFPMISHIQLIHVHGERLLSLRDSPTVTSSGEKHIWPNLQTIALSDVYHDAMLWLCDTVKKRIAAGKPLARVCLSHPARGHLRGSRMLSEEWLEQRVEVNVFSDDETGFITQLDESE